MSERNESHVDATVRVAIDTGSLLGPRTGIGLSVAAMLDAFTRLADPPTVRPYALSFRGALPLGTTRLPLPAAVAHRLWRLVDGPRLDRWLGDVDVVHGPNHVVPPSRHPRLVSVYDTWFLRHPNDVHPDVRRMGEVLMRSVRSGAVVHTSSHATAEQLREILSPVRHDVRIEVVHLGAFAPPPPPTSTSRSGDGLTGRRWILALATRERRKNLPRLIRAFGLAAAALGNDTALVVAGAPGNDDDAITAAIESLDAAVAARVVIAGRVDDARKAALLHGAAAVAYPSLDEGFGHPLLEAMGAGVPVVASTAGSIPEVAGDAALLVPPDDEQALAAALVTAVDDGAVRERLIAAGHVRVAEFDWTDTARRLAEVYRDLAMTRSSE